MTKKDKWSNQRESTLAIMGVALENATLLVVPGIFFLNDGATMWIPCIIMEIFIGIPLTFTFLSLGQYCSSGILTCWKFAPICSGIGGSMFVFCFLLTLSDVKLPAWSMVYLFNTGYLGSQDCSVLSNCSGVFQELFLETTAIGDKDDRQNLDFVNWKTTAGMVGVYLIVYLFLVFGVKVYGKIGYITSTLPFVCMLALCVRGATLEGSRKALSSVMTTQFEYLGMFKVWYEASLMLILRKSLVLGIYITIGSYNKFHNNTFRDTLMLVVYKLVLRFLAVITPVLFSGYMRNSREGSHGLVGIEKFYSKWPLILQTIPGGGIWMFILHIGLLCNFLNFMSCSVLTLITAITDLFPVLRKRIWNSLALAALCLLLFLFSFFFISLKDNTILRNDVDFSLVFSIPYRVILICSCIAVGYFYGVLKFSDDVKVMMKGKILHCVPSIVLKYFLVPMVCFFTPCIILISGVMRLANSDGIPTIKFHQSIITCILISSLIIVPIPLVAFIITVKQIVKTSGTLSKRLSAPFFPTKEWGPVELQHRQEVEGHLQKYGFVVDPSGSTEQEAMPFTNSNTMTPGEGDELK